MTTLCEQPPSTAPREDAPGLMLAALRACALAQGIAVITVTYDGYGDEGQIQDVTLAGATNEETQIADEMAMPEVACTSWAVPYRGDATPIETTFKAAIDDLALEMLALKHGGWEDGEGALGELVIDVAAGKATLEHSIRVVETECFTHEWVG